MKKISKKVSYLTKLMLVIGLIVSDLMPLKMVFAYEKDDSLVLSLNDTTLNIKYDGTEITNESLNITIEEAYTYLDETTKTNTKEYPNVTLAELTTNGINHESLISGVKYDGTYNAKVTISNELESESDESIVLATNEITSKKTFDKGIDFKIYKNDGTTSVEKTNGIYNVDNDYQVKVFFKQGGLAPTWTYTYTINDVPSEKELTADELLTPTLIDTINFEGYLAGEYSIPEKISLTNSQEETNEYNEELKVMYKSYTYNTDTLNNAVENKDVFLFEGDTKEGTLYVYPDLESNTKKTTTDIENIISSAFGDNEIITHEISGEDELSNNTEISLTSKDVTIKYKVNMFADTNGDGIVTTDDLEEIINSIVGVSKENLETEDINKDKKLNIYDAVYMLEMLKNKTKDITLGEETGNLSAYLNSKKDNISSGETFEIDYILTLKETKVNGIYGQVKYDKNLFSLESITNKTSWKGNNKDGKFLYLGPDSLSLKTTDETSTDGEETKVSYEEVEYTVLTLKFKALKSGTGNIQISDYKFINGTSNVSSESISTSVTINASQDASLKSLTINGESLDLKDDVLDYNLTVSSDVTTVSVDAVTNNQNAKILSIVKPEELVEGENTITITVEAENGDEQIYTIIVTKEKAKEDDDSNNVKPTNVVNSSNDNDDYSNKNDDKKKEEKTDKPSNSSSIEKVPVKDEGKKLSRVIIIILIILIIAGLIYLIFKDDNDDDDETKKTDREINKMKKEDDKEIAHQITHEKNNKQNKKSSYHKNTKKDK